MTSPTPVMAALERAPLLAGPDVATVAGPQPLRGDELRALRTLLVRSNRRRRPAPAFEIRLSRLWCAPRVDEAVSPAIERHSRSPDGPLGSVRSGLAAAPAARVAVGALVGFFLALVALVALPMVIGWRSLAVLSGSMEPVIHTGSVVVVERVAGSDIAAGDIVSFRDPEDPSRLITHRVLAIEPAAEGYAVQTKGDANTGTELWLVAADGTVGRVRFHIPYLGYAVGSLQARLPRLLLVVVPSVLLAALLVVGIWRPRHGGRPAISARAVALSPGGAS